MLTITATRRCQAGHESVLRDALLDVARHVDEHEPDTIGFFVSQDGADPCIFTTYERFADQAAMDRHNTSAAVARCFATISPILDGDVVLLTGTELSAKT